MRPIITEFEIFGQTITIHSFGTLIVLAFLVSAFYVRRRAVRDLDLDGERVFNICFALLFLGLAGGRLLYALVRHDVMSQEPLKFLKIWEGGLVFYGGLLTGVAWLAWYLPRHLDLKGFALVDRLALGTGLAVFVGRWASFLSGENYGKPVDGSPWWSVTYWHPRSAAPLHQALHPTQIYHSLHGLLLFLVLWFFLRRRPWPGRATGLFLALYALGTIVIEIWRGDDTGPAARGMVIEGLVSWNQLLSVPVFFGGLALFLVRRAPSRSPHS